MQDEKALALLDEILAKTTAGRVPWEPSVSGDTLLAAIKGKYSLILKPYTGIDSYGNEVGLPSLVMKDASDREILTVTSDLDGVNMDALTELYETARRQALRVDQQVEDLISDLKAL